MNFNHFKISEELWPFAHITGEGRWWVGFQFEPDSDKIECFKLCKNKEQAKKIAKSLNKAEREK